MKKFLGVSFIFLVIVLALLMSSGQPQDPPTETLKGVGITVLFIFTLLVSFYLLISHRQDKIQDKILDEIKKLKGLEKGSE